VENEQRRHGEAARCPPRPYCREQHPLRPVY